MKAGPHCWLRAGVLWGLEPTGRGVRACGVVPYDGLSTAGTAVPCSVSRPCIGWEGMQKTVRGAHVRSLALIIHGASALRICFTLSPQTSFLVKLKCLSTGAPGPWGRLGHRQSVVPATRANPALPKTPPEGQARPFTHLDGRKGNTGRVFFRRL